MTDEQQWQAPGAATPSANNPAASSPPPPTGTPQQTPYYGSAPTPEAGAAWAPPPKPGLIPLRPMALGTILGASFRVLRRNPRPTFGVALVIHAAAILVSLIIIGAITFISATRIDAATADDQSAIIAGTVGMAVLSGLLTVFLSLVAGAILQGIIVVEVARGTLGEKLPLRRLWGFAKGRIWALVGWAAIIGVILLVTIGIIVGIIVLMVSTMGAVGAVLGILLGVAAALGLTVLGVWLGTKLSLVPSALVLEQLTIRNAVARSWSLTNEHFWRVFGIQALVGMILGFASNIVVIPFSIIIPILMVLVDPNGTDPTASLVWVLIAYIIQIVVTVVIGTITSIVMTATASLLYLDLRMRKEGLDVELTRFVEARHMGADDDANPYLPRNHPSAASASGYTFG